jgi:DNA-binding transcriptional LysR family regulator
VNTTIDQWEVFEAVVKLGSFAAAATKLNRSQSTISYAVSRLQAHFKIPLLELKGRKACLTESGKALLADAESLLSGFRALERRGESLAAGGETQIHLSVDSVFPDDRLFTILAEFSQSFPHVQLNLHRGTLLTPAIEFANYNADICIAGTPTGEEMLKPILDIRMKAVARRDHPLGESGRELTALELTQSLAVIIEGATGPNRRKQPHSPSQRFLAVASIESAIAAVKSGLCFGWLPMYRIQSYLDSGEFVGLKLPLGEERLARMFIVLREFSSTRREKNQLTEMFGGKRGVEVI